MRTIHLSNVIIDRVTTTKDRGLRLSVLTSELPATEKVALMEAQGVEEVAIEMAPKKKEEKLTMSQKLRLAIMSVWEDENTASKRKMITDTFESFYAREMQRIIEGYKLKNLQK